MTTLDYFNSIDLAEIERFVAERQEEHLTLEFKTVNHPSNVIDHDRKNFSIALSGLGNSNGGIIIWGIKAKSNEHKQDVASAKAPIAELTKFLNFLNRTEGQAVIPLISGVLHEKIEEGADTGYVKTFIPPSNNAPHMAIIGGKHYYKRSGDSFYQCEHYDIVDMFSRKKSPDLILKTRILPRSNASMGDRYKFEIILSLQNNGKAIARYPYLCIDCNHQYRSDDYGLDGNKNCGLPKVAKNEAFRWCYSGGNHTVIHPGVTLDIDKYMSEVSKSEFPMNFEITYLISAENMENRRGNIVLDTRDIIQDSVTIPQ